MTWFTRLIKFQHIRPAASLSPVNKVYRSKRNIVKMALKTFVAFALLCGILICQARHIHPGNIAQNLIQLEEVNTDEPINFLHNLKPTRFVPLNTASFFKLYEPCSDGFKRDALGICREVWD